MAEIIFRRADGASQSVQARNGFSLMEVAVNSGVDGIDGECGGGCSCATCHIYIDAAWLAAIEPATSYEQELLDCLDDVAVNSRLSCQLKVSDAVDGIIVTIPAHQGLAG